MLVITRGYVFVVVLLYYHYETLDLCLSMLLILGSDLNLGYLINGHFRIRCIGGTYHRYDLFFRPMQGNLPRKYGNICTVPTFQDPEIPTEYSKIVYKYQYLRVSVGDIL